MSDVVGAKMKWETFTFMAQCPCATWRCEWYGIREAKTRPDSPHEVIIVGEKNVRWSGIAQEHVAKAIVKAHNEYED